MRGRNVRWVFGVGAALLLVAGAVAGFGPRDPLCIRNESARPLNLALASDRAHLRADLDDIHAVASAFGAAVARRPMLSDSIDAVAGAKTAPTRARAWCEAALRQQLATTHAIPVELVRSPVPE